MNNALALRLQNEAGVEIFDTFAFFSGVVANPAAFGFTNVGDACGAAAGAGCSNYLFWDGIHPTTMGHQRLAQAVFAQAVPEPETYALTIFGLGVVSWMARRRAARA